MTEYDNTNKGQIWKNDKKDTPNHPDFKGSIDVEGVEYWLSGWLRDKDGNPKAPAMRFSIQKKEAQSGGGETAPGSDGIGGGDDPDRIPFITRWGYL
ncbi:MAG: hypothetical protein KAI73_08630 [Rhodospirillaceae bacterium]|nr:hypothetical protein [Rhodospirillaceae bacterium]